MEKTLKSLLKVLKMNEETVSMILGAMVVIVVGVVAFNYFSKNTTGVITPDGAKTEIKVGDGGEIITEGEVTEVPGTYKVQKGDDLWKIALKFYKSGYAWTEIAKANKLSNPGAIEVGQELKMPSIQPSGTIAVKPTEELQKVEPVKTIDSEKYTVVKGDNLWKIAVRAYGDGYKWTDVYAANKAIIGTNPGLIYSGTELIIPGGK